MEISLFHTSVPNIKIICFTVLEIWHMTGVIIFHFGLFFALLPPNSPKNDNFKKTRKKCWRYHLTKAYQKSWSYVLLFLRYGTIGVIIFHFGLFFTFFTPNSPKNDIFKKMKKTLEISLFNKSVPKIMLICFTVPEIWHVTDIIVIFHFGLYWLTSNNKHEWTPINILMFCITIRTQSSCNNFFLIYFKSITNFIFWVFWTCLATSIKKDNTNL